MMTVKPPLKSPLASRLMGRPSKTAMLRNLPAKTLVVLMGATKQVNLRSLNPAGDADGEPDAF